MRQVVAQSRFEKDVKALERRGKNMVKLKEVISLLVNGDPLPERYRDHKLIGKYAKYKECHIEPDWLLIYKLEKHSITLVRTGTHSDLF